MTKHIHFSGPIGVFLLALFCTHAVQALPEQALVPGGIALLKLPGYKQDTKVYFNNKRIAVFPYKDTWVAMAGIGLSNKPGDYEFSIQQADGLSLNTRVTVKYKKYDEQHLTIKNKRKVNPNAEDSKRIASESTRKKRLVNNIVKSNPMLNLSGRSPAASAASMV